MRGEVGDGFDKVGRDELLDAVGEDAGEAGRSDRGRMYNRLGARVVRGEEEVMGAA